MARAIDLENAMDISTLYDWYITSVSQDDEPVWTEQHIDELFNDFYVIPKETPVIEAEPVVYCKDCIRWQKDKTYNIGYCDIINGHTNPKNFCCWGEESPFRKEEDE